ncbi:nucleoporin NUP42-like [Nerophis lumbriciformis]|uniref:nucleoporin NUP42-like n=1 Tax=Nerophis lumbriciformis TaxID=546530 RepID=UPI002ADF7D27|nr:nucleoporin NUP42-like [Nerophis lumbriciformis]
MAVCKYFLQGRCQFGLKCWNEHPIGGGGRGHNRSTSQQHSRGDTGHRNKVSVNPSHQKGGYSQQVSSRVSSQCGGSGHSLKSSEFSVSSQNSVSTLGINRGDDERCGRGGEGDRGPAPGEEDEEQKLEIIQTQSDMMVWESSGQSSFSCSSGSKAPLSGFADISPEEQRFEYYSTESYLDRICWLLIQWGNRMNQSTRAALLAELRYPAPRTSSSGFGSAPTGCGSSSLDVGNKGFDAEPPAQATNISLASPASGLVSPVAPTSPPGFSGAIPAVTQPPSGFDARPSTSSDASPGSPLPRSFGEKLAAPSSGTGSSSADETNKAMEKSGAPAGNLPGQVRAVETSGGLYSLESELTQEELDQFKAQRFTLGLIPLKPPSAAMLAI